PDIAREDQQIFGERVPKHEDTVGIRRGRRVRGTRRPHREAVFGFEIEYRSRRAADQWPRGELGRALLSSIRAGVPPHLPNVRALFDRYLRSEIVRAGPFRLLRPVRPRGRVVAVHGSPAELRSMLQALERPNRAALELRPSGWSDRGLTEEQAILVERYRPF